MKLVPLVLALALSSVGQSHAQTPQPGVQGSSGALQQKVAPAMAAYTDDILYGEVWPGDGLSPRDRSLSIVAALIATDKPAQLRGHLGRALTNGVTPTELSGVLTHVAVYAGWPNAVSALEVYDSVYTEQNIDFAELQAPLEPLSPSDPDAALAEDAIAGVGSLALRFTDLSDRVVFGDLWHRSDLDARDRSLVTIATLTSTGDTELLGPYLRRGVNAGLTRDEIAEALTHLGFYGGWAKATKALTVVNETLGD